MSPQQSSAVAPSPMKRPVKFVASDEDGLPVKRRQAQHACESCRKRKKRCPHESLASRPVWVSETQPRALPPSPDSLQHTDDASSAELVASQLIELSASRFVGDLSPESIFIEATTRGSSQPYLHRNTSDVGGWARAPTSDTNNGPLGGKASESASSIQVPTSHPLPLVRRSEGQGPPDVRDYLRVCPPDEDYEHLLYIYQDRVHPILPVIKEGDVHATKSPLKLSIRHRLFKQAIALTAAVDTSAASRLRLEPNGPVLSFAEFHQRLSKAIFSSLDLNILANRIDHIRILLILFFFYQPSQVSERDQSPLIFSQAVSYAQSLGIHLRGYKDVRTADGKEDSGGETDTLFCALWALDRFNASLHGRPCLLHERDIDHEIGELIAAQPPAFRLFLGVAQMLDKVIWLYRPRKGGVESVEMPVFESMIVDAGAERLPTRILATVEVFYHAVAVLSCRQPSSAFHQPAPLLAHLPHPNINARRSLSADRIVDSTASSLADPESSDAVCLLPFVPYAVALSLSVEYRKMRYSRIPMYRLRGRNRFNEIVALLHRLADMYSSARVNAGLGMSILREMDKTAKGLSGSAGAGATTSTTANSSSNSATPLEAAQAQRQMNEGAIAPTPGPAVTGQKYPRLQESILAMARRKAQASGEDFPNTHANHHHQPMMPPPHGGQLRVSNPSVPAESGGNDAVAAGHAPHPANLGPAASVSWGDLSDIDLFGHFDPGFDLGAVDAALEANLDMGFPQMWTAQWPE